MNADFSVVNDYVKHISMTNLLRRLSALYFETGF